MFLWYNNHNYTDNPKYMLVYSPSYTYDHSDNAPLPPGYYLWDVTDTPLVEGINGKDGLREITRTINSIIDGDTEGEKKHFSEEEIYRLFREAEAILEKEVRAPIVVNFSFNLGTSYEDLRRDFEERIEDSSEEEIEELVKECEDAFGKKIINIHDIPKMQKEKIEAFLKEIMSKGEDEEGDGEPFYFFDRKLRAEVFSLGHRKMKLI
jgi:hypothetical protein